MANRDEALLALKEIYLYHDTDTRFTVRLDKVKDYITYLEQYAPAEPTIDQAALDVPKDENGEPVDVPQGALAQSIAEPSAVDLDLMTVTQLRDLATERGVDLTGITLKADIIAAINKSEATA